MRKILGELFSAGLLAAWQSFQYALSGLI